MMIGTIVAKMRSFIEFMVLIMCCNYFDRVGHEFIRLNLFFIKPPLHLGVCCSSIMRINYSCKI